jgi:transposase
VLRRVSRRREVSSVVCLTAPLGGARARLLARHFLGTVRTPELIAAVRHFQRRLERPLILVLDRLNVHRSRATQAFFARHADELLLEWLPSYAPELNPDEQCNGWVKRDTLNALPATDAELRRFARRGFQRLGRRPDVLQSFFDHAGLNVT